MNTCLICNKELTNPESIARQMGEICANKTQFETGKHNNDKGLHPSEHTLDYAITYLQLGGKKGAQVIDHNKCGLSVINGTDVILNRHGLDFLIIKSEDDWTFYSKELGFKFIGTPDLTQDQAFKNAMPFITGQLRLIRRNHPRK